MTKESLTWQSLTWQRLKQILAKAALVVVALAALVCVADYIVFRVRVARNWNPYGSVTVTHYYAVLQKNGKTSFTFDPPQPWTCVHALFSHGGSSPCWYLSRHPEQKTSI